MENTEQTGAAEPRNDAPTAAPETNETPKQDEFDRLANLPDRHEIRIVIAEEEHAASLALRHEDFGKPGELAGVLAAGVKETVVKLSKVLAVCAALEGMDSSFQIQNFSGGAQ